ncbi:MAG: acyl-CoA dehydrogenase [bacterium]
MDVELTDEQRMLQTSAREFLTRACPMSLVRESMDDPAPACGLLWPTIAELGWLGLVLPAVHGGSELGLVELVLVLQEAGRALLPAPFFSTVALGAHAIALGGDESQRSRFLPDVAAGKLRVTLANLEESARWDEAGIQLPATSRGGDYVLDGAKRFVMDAALADWLVVPARTAAGVGLFLVAATAPGVTIRQLAFVDQVRKVYVVELRDVRIPANAVLGPIGAGWPILETLFDFAKVALCGEMCGAAERVLEMAADYAKVREQFGKPIGSFQAIQHKCAEMLVLIESAKSATYYAAWAIANGEPDAHTAACLAKAYTSEAFTKVAGEGIQVHGGIGFTWEQDLHLYFKRAKSSELSFGTPSWNRELAARVLLDGRG